MIMSNRIWMSSIMGPIGPEQLELFGLELWKIAAFDFVYCLTSTSLNQSAPILVTMNMNIRSRMSLIMGQVIPDQLVFSVLEIEKLNFSRVFGIYLHCQPVLFSTQVSDIGPSWSSCIGSILVINKKKVKRVTVNQYLSLRDEFNHCQNG